MVGGGERLVQVYGWETKEQTTEESQVLIGG
jgi:hypothetical protein